MNKKSILLFFISCIFLFSACSKPAESKTPISETSTIEAAETPSASTAIFTEEDYIKLVKGETSNPTIEKEIPSAEFFIRPALADENSGACIYINEQGYEFVFTPTDSGRYPNDASMFVSDMEFDLDTPLMDAMKAVFPQIDESSFTHVEDNELKHYMNVETIEDTGQKATNVYFIIENHLIRFTIFADVSDKYLGYCTVKIIFF